MRLGITQYAACPDGHGYLEFAAKMGLSGVEPFIPDANDKFLSWTDADVDGFVRQARELGVEVPSVAIGVFIGDPSIIESSKYEKAVQLTAQSLRLTSLVGAKTMLLCTFIQSNPDTPEKKSNLTRVLCDVEPLARELDVAIALESPLPADELAEMIDAVGSDYLGVYYDVGNAVYLGFDPSKEIQSLGSRIMSVHVKDSLTNLGDSHLGKGRLDLHASMKALDQTGYDGWLILETPGGDEAATREDIRLVEQYL